MGGGIEAGPEEIVARGQSFAALAGSVDGVRIAAALPRIAEALPGSLSAMAVQRLAREWSGALDRWAEAARRHGRALEAGGHDYEAVEEAVRRALGPREPNPPTPGPLRQRGVW